ncbi:MAG: class I SAM-dependent methyltransferase [Candidatus Hodarchaeales archaeon]|jgi:SAM-dependent methyltransferase
MHKSSLQMIENFLIGYGNENETVLDIGSCDINGNMRKMVKDMGMKYTGIDVCKGPNVDIVVEDPYDWKEIKDKYDLIVSANVFEHIEFPWLTMKEIEKHMKIGSFCLILAPSRGPEHKFPVDCWRFYPDGMKALAKWVDLKVVYSLFYDVGTLTGFADNSDRWGDCSCIMKKERK